MPAIFSKLTSKSQTVIPKAIRRRLGLKPGDRLRFTVGPQGVIIDRANAAEDDPFAVFTEWSGAGDEAAYGKL